MRKISRSLTVMASSRVLPFTISVIMLLVAKGKTLDEALKITRQDVADELEGLPPIKMHCSNLAADALHAAIEDYRKKKGEASGKGS